MTHMTLFQTERYTARLADGPADIEHCKALRRRCFGTDDTDGFDQICQHVLVEDRTGALVCCFRLLALAQGRDIGQSYAAQFYELTALMSIGRPMVEIGRFCTNPAYSDLDILRVAWAAMARFVDDAQAELLFGCSSFAGTDAGRYRETFALLHARHLAPANWQPQVKAPEIVHFSQHKPDMKQALRAMPPLLRSYLAMGGWVSDHAVMDHQLGTLHVFTGLEISAIPARRAKALRAAVNTPG
ncbi:MAG: GNAT family N-acetyltransferase [Rhodobacteraceae bacterium]|nr:GNAT family N-acetyltransferase [Paracoccaceae bacterium]